MLNKHRLINDCLLKRSSIIAQNNRCVVNNSTSSPTAVANEENSIACDIGGSSMLQFSIKQHQGSLTKWTQHLQGDRKHQYARGGWVGMNCTRHAGGLGNYAQWRRQNVKTARSFPGQYSRKASHSLAANFAKARRWSLFVAGPSVWNSLPDSLRDPDIGGNSFSVESIHCLNYSWYRGRFRSSVSCNALYGRRRKEAESLNFE